MVDDFNLHWVDVRSGRQQTLTRGTGHRDREPAWSPDGRAIVFVRSFDSLFCNEDDTIYAVSADGSGLRNLGYHGCSPMWSPDGSRLAFIRHGFSSLFVVPAGGGVAKRIGKSVDDYDWSPDGARLVFEQDGEIWVADADGRNLRRLTRSGPGRTGLDGLPTARSSSTTDRSYPVTYPPDGTRGCG